MYRFYLSEVLSSFSDSGRKFPKPLATKRIFLPVLVESSWKTFRRKFSNGWSAHSMSLRVKQLWKERQPPLDRHQRVFGFSQFLRICMHCEMRQACQFCYKGNSNKVYWILTKTYCLACGILEFKIVHISRKKCRMCVRRRHQFFFLYRW